MKKNIYFFLQSLVGSRVKDYYSEFLTFEKKSKTELERISDERLSSILSYTSENIPFYKKYFNNQKNNDLKQFPIIDKKIINSSFREFICPLLISEYPRNTNPLYSWKEVTTGGTSGIPLRVIHDRQFRDRGRASRLYSQYLCGFPIGTPYFRLWGSLNEIKKMTRHLSGSVLRYLTNEKLLNAFMMNKENIKKYIHLINSSEINYLMTYSDAAFELAEFALRNGIEIRKINSIMACAGTVTNQHRDLFSKVFGAITHNKYGSRECADIACECSDGGFHIYSNNVYLEIVDDYGNYVENGKEGNILITLLSNYSFPLVRYSIGDRGSLKTDSCDCGRPFPLLEKVEGRQIEFLRGTDGTYISPVLIRHLIGVIHNQSNLVDKFLMVQLSETDYELKIILNTETGNKNNLSTVNEIKKDLERILGEGAKLNIEIVSEIPLSGSGKFLYTINKVRKDN